MKRGDLVNVAISGYFGKLRPALVIQSDQFELTDTVTILPVSSETVDAPLIRLSVEPNETNGLRLPCQIMIDKVMSVKRSRISRRFGRLDPDTTLAVNRSLALFLGLA